MIEIRPGNDSDKNQVLELIEAVFGSQHAERLERLWHWQWHCDPRLSEPGFRGTVAEWRGRLIGTLSNIPAGLFVRGQAVAANWCVDILVYGSRLRQVLQEQKHSRAGQGPDLSGGLASKMLNHPSAGSVQMGKHVAKKMLTIACRIGFEALPDSGNWVRRLSYQRPLQRVLGKTMGMVIAAGANLTIPKIVQPKLEVNTLQGDFDARFDRLWAQVKNEYGAITRRDAATLNWRYRQHPEASYTVLTLETRGELRGYIVFSLLPSNKRLRAQIVDVLARSGDAEALNTLLAGALQQLRQQTVEKVKCYACGPPLSLALRQFGFELQLKDEPVIVRGLPIAELYVTRGDGDGG
jgi:hypothetical protein